MKKIYLAFFLALVIFCGLMTTAEAAMRVEVDLSTQLVRVYDGNRLIRVMVCSTGAPGTPTPVGDFRIQGKGPMFVTDYGVSARYYSAFYGNYLFHSILFDRTGRKLISRSVQMLGRPASHGCIRLNLYDARWLQEKVPRGTPVKILKSGKPGMVRSKARVEVKGKLYPAWLSLRWLEGQPFLQARQFSWFIPVAVQIKGTEIQLQGKDTTMELFLSEPRLKIKEREMGMELAPQLFADGPYLPLQPVLSALGFQSQIKPGDKTLKISDIAGEVYQEVYN